MRYSYTTVAGYYTQSPFREMLCESCLFVITLAIAISSVATISRSIASVV
jgi:hypothetical protein